MQTLNIDQIDEVGGGIAWLVVIPVAVGVATFAVAVWDRAYELGKDMAARDNAIGK
jgi:hypothetical protein